MRENMKAILLIISILISQYTSANSLIDTSCSYAEFIEGIDHGHLNAQHRETLNKWVDALKAKAEIINESLSTAQPHQLEKISQLKDTKLAITALKRAKIHILNKCMEEFLTQECVKLLEKIDYEKLGTEYITKIKDLQKSRQPGATDFQDVITGIIINASKTKSSAQKITKSSVIFEDAPTLDLRKARYHDLLYSQVDESKILLAKLPQSIRDIQDYNERLSQIIQLGEDIIYQFRPQGSQPIKVTVPHSVFQQIIRNGQGELLQQLEKAIQKGYVRSATGAEGIKRLQGAPRRFEVKFKGKRWGSKRFTMCKENGSFIIVDFLNNKEDVSKLVCP